MQAKTMEGLVGANSNMKLLNTPFRVYKDARRRGDTSVMERAMGYVNEFSDTADKYSKIAEEGMKEDAIQAKKKEKEDQENAIQKRKEEREKLEERIEEKIEKNKAANADTVQISEAGKAAQNKSLQQNQLQQNQTAPPTGIQGDQSPENAQNRIQNSTDGSVSVKNSTDDATNAVNLKPVIYTSAGKIDPHSSVSNAGVSAFI